MENDKKFVLSVLIVEDEFSFATELRMLVEDLSYNCAGIIDSAEEAIDAIKSNRPDVILLDINLKGKMTGLQLAEKISGLKIPILFITSFHDEATYNQASKMQMVGFLVKPLNNLTLMSAIDACLSQITPSPQPEIPAIINDSFLIKKGRVYYRIRLQDIYYIESDLEYITFYTNDNKFVTKGSLKKLSEHLLNFGFFRTHQRYVINLDKLRSINMQANLVTQNNGIKLPVSRRKRKELEALWDDMNSSINP